MKLLFAIVTASAVALTALPAQAQDRVVHSTTVTRHSTSSVHHDDARPARHGWRWKRVCKTRWTHHRKVRTCKKVRVRW